MILTLRIKMRHLFPYFVLFHFLSVTKKQKQNKQANKAKQNKTKKTNKQTNKQTKQNISFIEINENLGRILKFSQGVSFCHVARGG